MKKNRRVKVTSLRSKLYKYVPFLSQGKDNRKVLSDFFNVYPYITQDSQSEDKQSEEIPLKS